MCLRANEHQLASEDPQPLLAVWGPGVVVGPIGGQGSLGGVEGGANPEQTSARGVVPCGQGKQPFLVGTTIRPGNWTSNCNRVLLVSDTALST